MAKAILLHIFAIYPFPDEPQMNIFFPIDSRIGVNYYIIF